MANTTKIERAYKYIVSHLHHNGSRKDVLGINDHYEVRRLADGFGRTNDSVLIWDWSHVRDSSDEAILEMATALRKKVRAQNKADKKAAREASFKKQIQREVEAEMAFEMLAAFGPGTTVANVLNGRTYRT